MPDSIEGLSYIKEKPGAIFVCFKKYSNVESSIFDSETKLEVRKGVLLKFFCKSHQSLEKKFFNNFAKYG